MAFTYKTHDTKNIVLKRANVDVLMVPVVKWLNSYDHVSTHGCCQGEDCGSAYVAFCVDGGQSDLLKVLVIIDHFDFGHNVTLTVRSGELPIAIWYRLTFKDLDTLKRFNKYLETGEHAMWSHAVDEVVCYPHPYKKAKKVASKPKQIRIDPWVLTDLYLQKMSVAA